MRNRNDDGQDREERAEQTYRETRDKVAAAREKQLAELRADNERLQAALDRRKPLAIHGWSVGVEVNGEVVLTIGHNHLSGIENIDQYADVVRNAAKHLLAFIGADEQTAPGDDK